MAPRRSSRFLVADDANNDITNDQSELEIKESNKGRRSRKSIIDEDSTSDPQLETKASTRKRTKRTKDEPSIITPDKSEPTPKTKTLPRTKELSLKPRIAIGVDEAGRGPIAGPVVAAAIILPTTIPGITDSKKLTAEADREALYELIVSSPNVRYAIAVIDHKRIDEINILQATLEGMKKAVESVIQPIFDDTRLLTASAKEKGCYTIYGVNDENGKPCNTIPPNLSYHALIDGNKTPNSLPCPSNPIIKGDSLEYCIGAASILAKVTRDRIMHEYHELYPDYNLKQHKGYPTKDHLGIVKEIGGCEIHRRSFAPFKEVVVKKKEKITSFFSKK